MKGLTGRETRGIGFLATATALGYGVTIGSIPIIAKLIPPERFDFYAKVFPIASGLGPIMALRFEGAIVLARTKAMREAALNFCVLSVIAISAALFALLLILHFIALANGYSGALPTLGIGLGLLIGIAVALQAVSESWLVANEEARLLAILRFVTLLAIVLFQVCVGLAKGGGAGLVVAHFLGIAGPAGFVIARHGRKAFRKTAHSRRSLGAVFTKYRRYLFYTVPFTLLGFVRERTIYFIFSASEATGSAAFYYMAYRIMSMPSMFGASALRPVVFKALSKRERSGGCEIVRQLFPICGWVVVIAFPVAMVFSDTLYSIGLKDTWFSGHQYIKFVGVAMALRTCVVWLDKTYELKNRQDVGLYVEAVNSVLVLGALFSAIGLGISLERAVGWQMAALAVGYVLMMVSVFNVGGYGIGFLLRCLVVGVVSWYVWSGVLIMIKNYLGGYVGLLFSGGIVLLGGLIALKNFRSVGRRVAA